LTADSFGVLEARNANLERICPEMYLHPDQLFCQSAVITSVLPILPFGKPLVITSHTDGYISAFKMSKTPITFAAHHGPKNKKS
jgi:hypothetical protein